MTTTVRHYPGPVQCVALCGQATHLPGVHAMTLDPVHVSCRECRRLMGPVIRLRWEDGIRRLRAQEAVENDCRR